MAIFRKDAIGKYTYPQFLLTYHSLHILCYNFSVGEHFNPNDTVHGGPEDEAFKRVNIERGSNIITSLNKEMWSRLQHVGDLGNISVGNSGRATFRMVDKLVKISDIIGRSLVITEKPDDFGRGNSAESKINGNSGSR